jgi:hypothetical protein
LAGNINTNINVNVKSTGGARAAKDVNATNTALRKLGQATEGANTHSATLTKNTTRLGQASASSGRQFSAQAAGLGGLVGAYAGAAATMFALQQAFAALNRAAQVENIIKGTNTLAAKVGENGNKIIASLQAITQGQLSMGEAAEKANLALASGFSTKQIEELGKVATKVSLALGRNLNDAFERLVRGVSKLEPELLDELGIFTKIDGATRKYAATIGKSVTSLTEFERRQAMMNAVIEEGNQKFSSIDTAVPSAQKSLNVLATTLANLGTQFGILLSTYLMPIADFFSNSLAGAISVFGLVAGQVSRTAFTQLTAGADALSKKFEQQRISLFNASQGTVAATKALGEFNQVMKATPSMAMEFRGSADVQQAALQLRNLGSAGKIAAADLDTFRKAMQQQADLAIAAAAKYSQARDALLSKQALGKLSASDSRALQQYDILLRNAHKDQIEFTRAVSSTTVALAAQGKAATVASRALTILQAGVSGVAKAMGLLFRAVNVIFLIASFGPLILELLGKIELFNKAMTFLSQKFYASRDAANDLALGMRALFKSLDGSEEFEKKFLALGMSAEAIAKNVDESAEFISKSFEKKNALGNLVDGFMSSEQAAAGLFATVVGGAALVASVVAGTASAITLPFAALAAGVLYFSATVVDSVSSWLGWGKPIEAMFNGIVEAFGGVEENAADTFTRGLQSIEVEVARLLALYAETGNLDALARAEAMNLYKEAVSSATIAQQQFVGALAKTTGQSASLIQELLTDTFKDTANAAENTALQLDGVTIATIGARGEIVQLSANAATGINEFIGFKSAVSNLTSAVDDSSISTRTYLELMDATTTAQANLGNTLASMKEKYNYLDKVNQDNIKHQKAVEGNAEQYGYWQDRINKVSDEMALLEGNMGAINSSFNENNTEIAKLTQSYDAMSESVRRAAAISSTFKTVADSVQDFDLTGIINSKTGDIAANQYDIVLNRVELLKETEIKYNSVLAQRQSLMDKAASSMRPDPSLTEQIVVLTRELTGLDELRATSNKAITGLQNTQLQGLIQMTLQAEELVRTLRAAATMNILQGSADIMQAQNKAAASRASSSINILKIEADIASASSGASKSKLEAEKERLSGLAKNIELETEIATIVITRQKDQINALQDELVLRQEILGISKSALAEGQSFFDEQTASVLSAVADVAKAFNDINIANNDQDLKRQEIAQLEIQRFHDQKMVAIKDAQLVNEMALIKADSAARSSDFEARKQLLLAEQAESKRALEAEIDLNKVQGAMRLLAAKNAADAEAKSTSRFASEVNSLLAIFKTKNQELSTSVSTLISNLTTSLQTALSIGSSTLKDGIIEGLRQGTDNLTRAIGSTTITQNGMAADNPAVTAANNATSQDPGYLGSAAQVTNVQTINKITADTDAFRLKALEIENKANIDKLQSIQTTAAAQSAADAEKIANLQNQRNAEKAKADEVNAANTAAIAAARQLAAQQAKIQALAALQSLSSTAVSLGGAMKNAMAEKAQERVDKATARHNIALETQKQKLEASNSAIEAQNKATDEMLVSLKARRAIEKSMATVTMQGVNSASAYFELQQQYLDNLDTTTKQADTLKEATKERVLADAELALSEYELSSSALELTMSNEALEKAQNSIIYKLGSFIEWLGKLGNTISAIMGIVGGGAGAFNALSGLFTPSAGAPGAIPTNGANPNGANPNRAIPMGAPGQKNWLGEVLKGLGGVLVAPFKFLGDIFTKGFASFTDRFGAKNVGNSNETSSGNRADRAPSALGGAGGFEKILGGIGKALISPFALVGGAITKGFSWISSLFKQNTVAPAGGAADSSAVLGSGGKLLNIFGGIGKALMAPFKWIGSLFSKSINNQTSTLADRLGQNATQAQSQTGFLGKIFGAVKNTVGSVFGGGRGAQGNTGTFGADMGVAVAGAVAGYLAGGDLAVSLGSAVGAVAGKAIGTIAGKMIGGLVGSIVGSVLGGLIGNALGNFLGGVFESIRNWFARPKTSSGSANLETGETSSGGKAASGMNELAKYAVKLNDAMKTVTNMETGIKSFYTQITTKGSSYRGGYVEAGGHREQIDPRNAEETSKKIFKVLAKSFADNVGGDIEDAVKRMDFGASLEDNLKKMEFASKFRDIINTLGKTTQNFTTYADYVNSLTQQFKANIEEFTGGAVSQFVELRKQTEDVFGKNSSQYKELISSQKAYYLNLIGLTVETDGTVNLIKDFSKNLNNMALVFANITAETMGMRDALIATGISGKEADRILREGVELRLREVADSFRASVTDALGLSGIVGGDILPKLKQVLLYQKNVVEDAVLVEETLSGYAGLIADTEELIYRQRADMIREASYEELVGLKHLTQAGSEFSNAFTKAAVDAEITRRKVTALFEGMVKASESALATTKAARARSALTFATGGYIPSNAGEPNKDSVPALLMPGEFVINKKAVALAGLDTLMAINNGVNKYAEGGMVAYPGKVQRFTAGGQASQMQVVSPIKVDTQRGGTINIDPRDLAVFQKFGQDTNDVLSFKEASEIVNQANSALFDTYKSLQAAAGSSMAFNDAMDRVYATLQTGDILLAQAQFSLATGLVAATTQTEAYNKVIADSRTSQLLNIAGINKGIDSVDGLSSSLDTFFYNIQGSNTNYADLSRVTSDLNLLLAQEVVTTDEYSNALNSVLQAYDDSIAKIQEYSDWFLTLQDFSMSESGIIASLRAIVVTFQEGTDYIGQAVKDGFINTVESAVAQGRVQAQLNTERLALIKGASEEELKILRDTTSSIVSITERTGASLELLARRLDAISGSYGSFETIITDLFNSTLEGAEGLTRRVVRSIEATIKEGGLALDDSTPSELLGTLAVFLNHAKDGTVDLTKLSSALGELNYQLTMSESINTDQYATGVSILATSFEQFAAYAYELNSAFIAAQDELSSFASGLKSTFEDLSKSIKDDIESMVSSYKSSFEDLKSIYNEATGNQADAEKELYDSLFAAQQAFSNAGGNLDGHVAKIQDIVNGLDPQYMGYPGLLAYLNDLEQDVTSGIAAIGQINTSTPLATLQANLTRELSNLNALKALPDSADKFVKMSRSLSLVQSLQDDIAGANSTATAGLTKAALDLIAVEKELNKNNVDPNLRNIDLTLTEITEDLVTRATTARDAYNEANATIDGYNAALANSAFYTAGLTDVTVSSTDAVANFTSGLQDLEGQWGNVNAAISAINMAGLSTALVDITAQTDAYAISIRDSNATSSESLASLLATIDEFTEIEAAKSAYEALYGAITITAAALPLDEFNRLNNEVTALEGALRSLIPSVGSSITTFGEDLQQFLLDAIDLLESPLKIATPVMTAATSVAATVTPTTLNTAGTAGTVNFGTSATNALLTDILTLGLGVHSPGYLYYTNQYLEDIKSILSDLLVVSGGVVPALNSIPSPTMASGSYTPSGATSTGSTSFAGPSATNLSALTGQLFGVADPIFKPADYFYIVTPLMVTIDHFFNISKADYVLEDWANIVKMPLLYSDWFYHAAVETTVTDWFNAPTTIATTWSEWFNPPTLQNHRWQDWWATATLQKHAWTDWWEYADLQKHSWQFWWDTPDSATTDFWVWFVKPTPLATGFFDWFTTTKATIYATDFFTISQTTASWATFFNMTTLLDISTMVKKSDIIWSDLFNISTQTVTYKDWFVLATPTALAYTNFFTIATPPALSFSKFFTISSMKVKAEDIFTLEPKDPTANMLFSVQISDINANNLFNVTGSIAIAATSLVSVNTTTKIALTISDIIASPITGKLALGLKDIFTNHDGSSLTFSDQISLSLWDLINKTAWEKNGAVDQIELGVDDLFSNVVGGKLALVNKQAIMWSDVFLAPSLQSTDFWYWFDKSSVSLVPISDVIDPDKKLALSNYITPGSADMDSLLTITGSKVQYRPEEVFAITPGEQIQLTASALYTITKTTIDLNALIAWTAAKVNATDVVDFTHLKNNKYIASATDVFEVSSSSIAGSELYTVSSSSELEGNKFFSPKAVEMLGGNFFTPTSQKVAGNLLFTPTPTTIAGGSIFTVGQLLSVDAKDLLTINKSAIVDITGLIETDMGTHNALLTKALSELILIKTHTASISTTLSTLASSIANEIATQFFSTFASANATGLNAINQTLGTISTYVSAISTTLTDNLPSIKSKVETYLPYLLDIETNTKSTTDELVKVNTNLATLETTANSIETYSKNILAELKTINTNIEALSDTISKMYDGLAKAINDQTITQTYLLQKILDNADSSSSATNTLLGSLELILTDIVDYLRNTLDARITSIAANTNNIYVINRTWLPIIGGYGDIDKVQVDPGFYIDSVYATMPADGGVTKTRGTLEATEDVLVSTNGIKGFSSQLYLEAVKTNDKLDHVSDNLDTLDGSLATLDGNLDHLSGNLDHLSGNLDHLSDNLDTVNGYLKSLVSINKTRYTYTGATVTTLSGYKTGGLVEGPGTGTSDSITAKLSSGEFVMKANAVSKLGSNFLDTLNSTGDISAALGSMGIKGDNQIAHINQAEAALLKSLGGAGTKNKNTGLSQYFFDGRPTPTPPDNVTKALNDSAANYMTPWGNSDSYPQWLYSANASSYWKGYNASKFGNALSDAIKTASYAKGKGFNYEHKQYGKIKDQGGQYGANSSNGHNSYELAYDWNDWNSGGRVDMGTKWGNPSTVAGNYNKGDWPTLVSNIWKEWGVTTGNIIPEGLTLAQQAGIPGFKDGGMVSGKGTGTSDSMLARISDGEYIVRNSSVDNVGLPTLDYINRNGALPNGDTNVEVNITNNGQPVDVQGEPNVTIQDGKVIIDVILKDLRTNGPIRKTIKKIK